MSDTVGGVERDWMADAVAARWAERSMNSTLRGGVVVSAFGMGCKMIWD